MAFHAQGQCFQPLQKNKRMYRRNRSTHIPQQDCPAIRENTKAVFIETLGNPNSDVTDIEKLAQLAHAHKIPLVVDNTFAT